MRPMLRKLITMDIDDRKTNVLEKASEYLFIHDWSFGISLGSLKFGLSWLRLDIEESPIDEFSISSLIFSFTLIDADDSKDRFLGFCF